MGCQTSAVAMGCPLLATAGLNSQRVTGRPSARLTEQQTFAARPREGSSKSQRFGVHDLANLVRLRPGVTLVTTRIAAGRKSPTSHETMIRKPWSSTESAASTKEPSVRPRLRCTSDAASGPCCSRRTCQESEMTPSNQVVLAPRPGLEPGTCGMTGQGRVARGATRSKKRNTSHWRADGIAGGGAPSSAPN